MQQKRASTGDDTLEATNGAAGSAAAASALAAGSMQSDQSASPHLPRCYGIQVLVAGRRKCWRDRVRAQIRRAGYTATSVDCAIDALTVLALGLPVDVLVTDTDLHGDLRSDRLAIEARALRPSLGIVFARDLCDDDLAERVPDALTVPAGAQDAAVTVREAIAARV